MLFIQIVAVKMNFNYNLNDIIPLLQPRYICNPIMPEFNNFKKELYEKKQTHVSILEKSVFFGLPNEGKIYLLKLNLGIFFIIKYIC